LKRNSKLISAFASIAGWSSTMSSSDGHAVELRNVVKRYADITAVDNIDLDVGYGEIFGLLGPNGSGKSTTMKMILGLLKPNSGSLKVLGVNVRDDPVTIKRQVGYVPETPRLYEFLTGLEYLDFIGDIYGVETSEKRKRVATYLSALELEGREGDLINSYSQGMKQKIALISALIHKPRLLILDEPLNGLDPKSARIVKDLLRELASQGVTIIISTHILEIAQAMCDRIAIMYKGRLQALGDMNELREKARMPGSDLEDIFLKLTGTEGVRELVEALLK
jgi:ABC-2 type transport system ATP-binding protein